MQLPAMTASPSGKVSAWAACVARDRSCRRLQALQGTAPPVPVQAMPRLGLAQLDRPEDALHIPDPVVDLAGFALGHALWNVCDFEEEDEVLCPLAFTFDGEQKQLLRFEAESQEDAIEVGLSTLAEDGSLIRWAFAREGTFRTESGSVDVVLVEAWGQGLEGPVVFAQAFAPATSGRFALLGQPAIFVADQPRSDPSLVARLRAGVMSHQKAAELWGSWQGW